MCPLEVLILHSMSFCIGNCKLILHIYIYLEINIYICTLIIHIYVLSNIYFNINIIVIKIDSYIDVIKIYLKANIIWLLDASY